MILAQVFKTGEGATKRAAFETAHCGGKYRYRAVRFYDSRRDGEAFDSLRWKLYTWRLERVAQTTQEGKFNDKS